MTAKEYLEQYRHKELLLLRVRDEYRKELDHIDTIRSALDSSGITSGQASKTVELKAMRLAEKAERLREAELEALATRQKVFDVIAKIVGVKGQVLYERYINLKKWEDVAAAVNYEERHTRRIHAEALRDVEELLTDPSKYSVFSII